jgi:hypothetical protein
MFNALHPANYEGRLHNTVVLYDGWPCLLTVQGIDRFNLTPLHSKSQFVPIVIKPTDPKLDISPTNLGWTNTTEGSLDNAVYFMRHPVRKWRQGLCETNTSCQTILNGLPRKLPIREYLYRKGFEDSMRGVYPTLDEAFDSLKKGAKSVAPCREIAIVNSGDIYKVYYHMDEVGWITPGKKLVKVPRSENAYYISKWLRNLPWVIE